MSELATKFVLVGKPYDHIEKEPDLTATSPLESEKTVDAKQIKEMIRAIDGLSVSFINACTSIRSNHQALLAFGVHLNKFIPAFERITKILKEKVSLDSDIKAIQDLIDIYSCAQITKDTKCIQDALPFLTQAKGILKKLQVQLTPFATKTRTLVEALEKLFFNYKTDYAALTMPNRSEKPIIAEGSEELSVMVHFIKKFDSMAQLLDKTIVKRNAISCAAPEVFESLAELVYDINEGKLALVSKKISDLLGTPPSEDVNCFLGLCGDWFKIANVSTDNVKEAEACAEDTRATTNSTDSKDASAQTAKPKSSGIEVASVGDSKIQGEFKATAESESVKKSAGNTTTKPKMKLKTKADELCHAAYKGDIIKFKKLLAEGVPVTAVSGQGDQAIHWAARYGRIDILKHILMLSQQTNDFKIISAETKDKKFAIDLARTARSEPAYQLLVKEATRISAITMDRLRKLVTTEPDNQEGRAALLGNLTVEKFTNKLFYLSGVALKAPLQGFGDFATGTVVIQGTTDGTPSGEIEQTTLGEECFAQIRRWKA